MKFSFDDLVVKVIEAIWIKSQTAFVHHPQCLLQSLLKLPSNGHHLSHTLHTAANAGVHVGELGQIPARDLIEE